MRMTALGRGGDLRAVGDDDEGQALSLTEVVEELEDLVLAPAVEIAGGLVGQEQGGFVGQGAGDGDPLALADREVHRTVVPAMGQADLFDQGLRALDALPTA